MAVVAKHKFTPKLVRQILTSTRFQNRLELWTIIHALGSNTKARFEQTKMHGGRTLCYALRRLANNIQEPFRTLSLNAIDASIKWWHGKTGPTSLCTSCSMVPHPKSSTTIKEIPTDSGISKSLTIRSHATIHRLRWFSSSTQLFWTNSAITRKPWMTGLLRTQRFAVAKTGHRTKPQHSILLTHIGSWLGSLLHSMLPPGLAVIAEGSLSNKVFPFQKRMPKPDATGHEELDKTQRLTVHAEL